MADRSRLSSPPPIFASTPGHGPHPTPGAGMSFCRAGGSGPTGSKQRPDACERRGASACGGGGAGPWPQCPDDPNGKRASPACSPSTSTAIHPRCVEAGTSGPQSARHGRERSDRARGRQGDRGSSPSAAIRACRRAESCGYRLFRAPARGTICSLRGRTSSTGECVPLVDRVRHASERAGGAARAAGLGLRSVSGRPLA